MSKPMLIFLLAAFSIHLAVFLHLAIRHRKVYHFLAVITFILLLIATGLRLVLPEALLGQYPLYRYFKYPAWLTTAALVIFWFRERRSGKAKL